MTDIKNVALTGANGKLGALILKALVEEGFSVTILTRAITNSALAYPPGVKQIEVEYSNPSTLYLALLNQDAIISTVGDSATLTQEALIDAAIEAGVKRIIPSEYGSDPDHAAVRALPVFTEKQRIADYVRAKTAATLGTTYSLICTNGFFDFDLEQGLGIDVKNKRMEIFDGGDVRHTVTTLPFVAKGVLAILKHSKETANRVVRLHGKAVTHNWLLKVCQRVLGEEGWEIERVDSTEREREAWKALRNDEGDFLRWALPFYQVSSCAERYGGEWSLRHDNQLLGLEELTDGDIEEIVKRHA